MLTSNAATFATSFLLNARAIKGPKDKSPIKNRNMNVRKDAKEIGYSLPLYISLVLYTVINISVSV